MALLCATFIILVDNRHFWTQLFKVVDITSWQGFLFSFSIFGILACIVTALLLSLSARLLFKPLLASLLLLSAIVSYFQVEYSIIVDKNMIQNVFETDVREASELLSFSFVFHLAVFGLLPIIAVTALRVRYGSWIRESAKRVMFLVGALILAGILIWANYKNFVLIGREHRELRMLINPTSTLYETYKYAKDKFSAGTKGQVEQIGLDAKQNGNFVAVSHASGKKNLVVLVVGETARSENFSLNGYQRKTNPELEQDGVVSFRNAYSCGTSTAESVPCIFSHFDRENYSSTAEPNYENILDVLSHAGVHVLWRDNNSGCKGACARVETEDVSNLTVPELCSKEECFDEILLHQLQDRIKSIKGNGDILVVLHQKGSHGPAYYKRHPQEFSKFMPECMDNAPQNCEREALINAYDNTIAYTDHLLHRTIEFLKKHNNRYNSVLLYASDHGESLGENGIYLHGLPYVMAPEQQRHIPIITWVSDSYAASYGVSNQCLMKQVDMPYSHDNIFHSLLGLFGVETSLYRQDHDIFSTCMSAGA